MSNIHSRIFFKDFYRFFITVCTSNLRKEGLADDNDKIFKDAFSHPSFGMRKTKIVKDVFLATHTSFVDNGITCRIQPLQLHE